MEEKNEIIVVILAGGMATRLSPLSERIPKPLMPIGSKPIIHHIIYNFKEAGFSKFIILVGYKAEMIEDYFSNFPDINISYVTQLEQKGMADAVLICSNFIKKNLTGEKKFRFFVTASDLLLTPSQINDMFNIYLRYESDIVLSLMKSLDVQMAEGFANIGIEKDFDMAMEARGLKIKKILEKPNEKNIMSYFYSTPIYFFSNKIVEYLGKVSESERGELELQDAIQMAIDNGNLVMGIDIFKKELKVEDIGKFHLTFLTDLITMNREYLRSLNSNSTHSILLDNVIIGEDVEIDTCIINENCVVGDFTKLHNAILFRNVNLGVNVSLNNCIVVENTQIPDKYSGQNLLIMQNSDGELMEIEIS